MAGFNEKPLLSSIKKYKTQLNIIKIETKLK